MKPTARERQTERERCARTGQPVPDWAKLKSAKGRPRKQPELVRPQGKGDQKRAHIRKRVYSSADLLKAPAALKGDAKAIYETLALTLDASGTLTAQTQGPLFELAIVQAEQWQLGAAVQTAKDDGERTIYMNRFVATLTHTDRLRRALEFTNRAMREGLHSSGPEPGDEGDDGDFG